MVTGAGTAVAIYAGLDRRWRQEVRGFNIFFGGADAYIGAGAAGAFAQPNLDDSHLYGIGRQLLGQGHPSAAAFGGAIAGLWTVLAVVRSVW